MMKSSGLIWVCLFLVIDDSLAQLPPSNYDESRVPAYTLPNPLKLKNGKRVTSVATWEKTQRPAILRLFKENIYGEMPGRPSGLHMKITATDSMALNGLAILKQVTIYFSKTDSASSMQLLLYLPKNHQPVPVFVNLNFCGNHCITEDTTVLLSTNWIGDGYPGVVDNKASETARGSQVTRWPLDEIIQHGYGIATVYYGDLEPDHVQGWKKGIRHSLSSDLQIAPEAWSAIGAWAWGISRIQDYLETDPGADAKKTIVVGHSRLGKAALWSAANDRRFAIIISNNSGEGGAALSKRFYGETIANLNTSFPHWFVGKYKSYNNNAAALPVDQHMLISLLAPRPVYITSAEEDKWADPKGEFLAGKNAEPVYRLYHKQGLGVDQPPPVNIPVGQIIRYHVRTGKHDITLYDWMQFIKFADENLKQIK